MALINCPECGKEVSDSVKVCIHCGYAIEKEAKKAQKLKQKEEKLRKKAESDISVSKVNAIAKKKYIGVFVAIVAVIALAFIIIAGNININRYRTPINIYQAFANTEELDIIDYSTSVGNGIEKTNLKKFFEIVSKSVNYSKFEESCKTDWEDEREYNIATYGDGYQVEIFIDNKMQLEKNELEYYRRILLDEIKILGVIGDVSDDTVDVNTWRKLTDGFDLTKSELEQLFGVVKSIYDNMGRLDVSDGYRLAITKHYKSNEELKPSEEYQTANMVVLKVNGSWVLYDDNYGFECFHYMIDYIKNGLTKAGFFYSDLIN